MDGRRFFGAEHRAQRERIGVSRAFVAERAGYCDETVKSVELGRRPPSAHLAAVSDQLFDLHGALRRLGDEARADRSRFDDFVAREREATHIRTYDVTAIPGLLQTPAYARAVITALSPDADVEQEVRLRLTRQDVVATATLRAVLDESALYRVVGTRAKHREQLARLLDPAPGVAVQVLPLSAPPHPGLAGPLTLLSLPDRTLARADGRLGVLVDEIKSVMRVERDFEKISAAALPDDLSAELIAAVLEET